MFDIQQIAHDQWTVVAVVGDLDLSGAPAFRVAVAAAARTAAEQNGGLAIDLSAVDFIDSVGVGLVLGGFRRQCDRDLPFGVVVSGSARQLLDRLRLGEIITLYDRRAELDGAGS